jgi:hypothetical protein
MRFSILCLLSLASATANAASALSDADRTNVIADLKEATADAQEKLAAVGSMPEAADAAAAAAEPFASAGESEAEGAVCKDAGKTKAGSTDIRCTLEFDYIDKNGDGYVCVCVCVCSRRAEPMIRRRISDSSCALKGGFGEERRS